VSPDCMI